MFVKEDLKELLDRYGFVIVLIKPDDDFEAVEEFKKIMGKRGKMTFRYLSFPGVLEGITEDLSMTEAEVKKEFNQLFIAVNKNTPKEIIEKIVACEIDAMKILKETKH